MMRIALWTRWNIQTIQCGDLSCKIQSRLFTRFASNSQYATKRLSIPYPVDTSSHTKTKSGKAFEYSSPEATFARHILRTILRECTYLPDSVAAGYIKQHALFRFRANAYKAWKDRALFEEQDKSRRQEARQAISTLQRANGGERACLLKVLHLTYGRIGKRRHELLRPLLSVPGQQEVLNAGSTQEGSPLEHDGAFLDGQDHNTHNKESTAEYTILTAKTPLDITPQLRALLQSQVRVKPPPTNRRSNPRRIEPIIPELNSWLRPTPQKVIRNARKKQYAQLLDHVQPPLPIEEWERLRDLASGKLAVQRPASRRKQALVLNAEYEGREEVEGSALDLVAWYGRLPRKAYGNRQPQSFTPRVLQRLYAELFSQCPLMEWDNAKEEWKVTWGFQVLLLPDDAKKPNSEVDKLNTVGLQ